MEDTPTRGTLGQLDDAIRALFETLSKKAPYACLLDGGGETSALNQKAVIGLLPRTVLKLETGILSRITPDEKGTETPETIETLLTKTDQQPEAVFDTLRRVTGTDGFWMGYFGYEFNRYCEPVLMRTTREPKVNNFPDLLLCDFSTRILIDRYTGDMEVLGDTLDKAAVSALFEHLLTEQVSNEHQTFSFQIKDDTPQTETFSASFSPEHFSSTVETLREKILSGDLYQANLSIRFEKQLKLKPTEIYRALCRRNPSPFSGIFRWPGGMILCNSPERLFRLADNVDIVDVDPGKTAPVPAKIIETRPIAGTRGRGQTQSEDEAIGTLLLANEKERAEHLMLVDLERNDLGRVCVPGSVEVDELLVLERYSHVTHLVSNVRGRLKPELDFWDVLKSMFPGGTITGCPKVRCMEVLSDLEPVARGPYTGSLGYFDPLRGEADFNILIRSIFLRETPAPFVYNTSVHVGAGIVADSVGAHEYRECLRKAQASLGVLNHYGKHDESGNPGK